MKQLTNLKKCKDVLGVVSCFGCTPNGYCKVLKNTNQVPCPFYKDRKKVLDEDPNYHYRGL